MTSHERAYKFRFYPDATQESTIESMRKNNYHTISASNDNHMKLMRAERKPQNEPVKQDTQFAELPKFLIITYLKVIVIAIIGFIMHTWFQ